MSEIPGMPAPRLLLFGTAFVLLCWYAMMAVHELGHVLAAYATGGTVVAVILEPLSISRTEIGRNPHPGVVVWSGPIIGVTLPLATILTGKPGVFFAGFCLIANGAYIGVGSFDGVGDCGLMLLTGTPMWAMWLFGATATCLGLYLWHTLGSFWRASVSWQHAWLAAGTLTAVILVLAARTYAVSAS